MTEEWLDKMIKIYGKINSTDYNKCICQYIHEYVYIKQENGIKEKILIEELGDYSNIKIITTEAKGVMYFRNLECKFISGGHGKGKAPKGNYHAYQYIPETRPSFTINGIGFQVPIEPQFQTDRSCLAIHPDGGILGSLGCIALIPENSNHLSTIANTFKNYFDVNKILPVQVL